ncbi:MAG: DUF3052 family protein [Ornithinimicrobium sp.]
MAGTDNSSVVATVDKLGFKAGQIVIEFGYDDDVDGDFRQVVEAAVGSPLEDEAYDGVVDALTMLEEGGFIALVTPGRKRSDRVEAHDVAEACTTSGLTATGAVPLSPEWLAQRLVGRK